MPGGAPQSALNMGFTMGKSEGPSLLVTSEGYSDGLADEDLGGGFDFVFEESFCERVTFRGKSRFEFI